MNDGEFNAEAAAARATGETPSTSSSAGAEPDAGDQDDGADEPPSIDDLGDRWMPVDRYVSSAREQHGDRAAERAREICGDDDVVDLVATEKRRDRVVSRKLDELQ